MVPSARPTRAGVTLAALGVITACGESQVLYLDDSDGAVSGPAARTDAEVDAAAAGSAEIRPRSDFGPGSEPVTDQGVVVEDAQALRRSPPPPPPRPPMEPPEAAQPPPIIGERSHLPGATVDTLAGSDEAGLSNGTGTQARFHNPVGVALGPDGDLYVADFDNDRIRRVTPLGVVTTLHDTPPIFQRPFGLTFDDMGRLFIQTDGDTFGRRDFYTATIWQMSPDTGAAMVIVEDVGRTRGLAPMTSGDLLVTDNAWHVLRRLDPETHEMMELAGSQDGEAGYADGAGESARFFRPYGAARMPDGHIVVADARNHCLREVFPDGSVATLLGTCGQPGYVDGEADGVLFNFPQDVAVDAAGEIFVTDLGNHCIRMVGIDGTTSTLAGDGFTGHQDGPGANARFQGQEGLDVTPDGQTIYVADGDFSQGMASHYVRVIRRTH